MIDKNKSGKNGPVAIAIGSKISKYEINLRCQEPSSRIFIFSFL